MALKNTTLFPEALNSFFFQKAWDVFWKNRGFVFGLVFVSAVILSVFIKILDVTFLSRLIPPPLEESVPTGQYFLDLIQYLSRTQFLLLLGNILISIPKTFFIAVFVIALPLMYEDTHIHFAEAFSVNFATWFMLYIYSVFALLLEAIGLMMCIIPGVILIIQLAFLPFVIVLEKDVHIITRCFRVVSGCQWNVFILYLLYFFAMIIPVVISMFFSVPQDAASVPAIETGEPALSLTGFIGAFVEQLISLILLYFMIALLFQQYMISRIEKGEIEVVPSE